MKLLKTPKIWAILLSTIVLLSVIIIPISVGDGGSKYAMLERTGLAYSAQPQEGLAQTAYASQDTHKISFANIHELLISLTNAFGFGYNTSILCVIYAVLFLLGMWLLIGSAEDKKQGWHRWLTAIISVFILSDLAYMAYFNSLYAQPLFMSLFVLFFGLTIAQLKNGLSFGYATGLMLCGVAVSALDTQSAVISFILGLAVILTNLKAEKKLIAVMTGIVIIVSSGAFVLGNTSPDHNKNLYNSVFYGVANFDSVEELGLDKELDALKGTFYSEKTVSEYQLDQKLFAKIGYGDIFKYYASHPSAFFGAISAEASNCFRIQAEYEGNFLNRPKQLAKGFNLYSYIKAKFFPNTIIFILLFFVIYFALVIFLIIKGKDSRKPLMLAMLLLGLCGIISFVSPYFISGMVELHHSMFAFYLIFDLMVLSSIIGGSYMLKERNSEAKEKFGVNQ